MMFFRISSWLNEMDLMMVINTPSSPELHYLVYLKAVISTRQNEFS
jgi:hypothetical protein